MLQCEQPFVLDAKDTWIDEVNLMLQGIAFAMRVTIGSTIKHSPSQIVFNQDMITCIKDRTDWNKIRQAREKEKLMEIFMAAEIINHILIVPNLPNINMTSKHH